MVTAEREIESLLDHAGGSDLAPASRRMLVAAAAAFAERGYHATTTRDISARAGMSPAAIYVHYSSKEELLFALIRLGHEQAWIAVRDAAAAGADPAASLRLFVRAFTYWHARQHTVARVAQDELTALTPEHFAVVAAIRRELEGLLRTILDDGRRAGVFTVDDVAGTALALLSLSIDVARWYPHSTGRTPLQIGNAYAVLALRMVVATTTRTPDEQ